MIENASGPSRHAYLDASAIVKLVVAEPETAALEADAASRASLLSSRLSATEASRAVRRTRQRRRLQRLAAVLESLVLIDITTAILEDAATIGPQDLRTLDAIHVATARSLGISDLDVITYDDRLATAAKAAGLRVVRPGAVTGARQS